MAHGNFDSALTLNDDGSLTVCGPIHWNGTRPFDLRATELEITLIVITQRRLDGCHVIGTATPNARFMAGTNEWMLDVADTHIETVDEKGCSGGFEPGPAHAHAIVRVTVEGRTRIATETWNENVSLSSQ
jgi:hypothetical protein